MPGPPRAFLGPPGVAYTCPRPRTCTGLAGGARTPRPGPVLRFTLGLLLRGAPCPRLEVALEGCPGLRTRHLFSKACALKGKANLTPCSPTYSNRMLYELISFGPLLGKIKRINVRAQGTRILSCKPLNGLWEEEKKLFKI